MKRLVALGMLWLLCVAGVAHAQALIEDEDHKIREKICAEQACQRNVRVTLDREGKEPFDETFDVFPPVVQPIGILVAAGQTIHVEAEIIDGKLVDIIAVDEVAHPEKTITATLTQSKDGGMMLMVSNPFDKVLKFSMGMMPLGEEGLFKTSSCPIIAHGSIFEMWPYPIFQIVLGDGRILEDDDDRACTE